MTGQIGFKKESKEAMKKKADAINPSYYGPEGLQPDDYSRAHDMSNMIHQTLKYITRAGKKDPSKHVEDLEKALNCLKKEIKFVKEEEK